jgi:acetyl esterase
MSRFMTSGVEVVSPEVAAEARAFNERLEATLATLPTVTSMPAPLLREARRNGKGIFPAPVFLPEARDHTVPSRGGTVKIRVLRPRAEPTGIYLHMHGGGWMLGAADLQDRALAELANATNLVVASVEYRLAPEHPYPAAADDCEDAARWLLAEGTRVLEAPPRFAIGGESAGAHLAVVTLLRLEINSFCAANLVFGAYDMSMTPSQRAWGARNLVLSTPIIEAFGNALLPGMTMEARRAPDISPLFAELHGMPSALFTVGTLDPLLDDTLFMEARWRSAAAASELRIWPEAIHGFTAFPLELARLAEAAQFQFLARAITGQARQK